MLGYGDVFVTVLVSVDDLVAGYVYVMETGCVANCFDDRKVDAGGEVEPREIKVDQHARASDIPAQNADAVHL